MVFGHVKKAINIDPLDEILSPIAWVIRVFYQHNIYLMET